MMIQSFEYLNANDSILICFIFCAIIGGAVTLLFAFHVNLVIHGISTLDSLVANPMGISTFKGEKGQNWHRLFAMFRY